MSQQSAPAARSMLRLALRLLVLLGGAFVWWLLSASAPAQADDADGAATSEVAPADGGPADGGPADGGPAGEGPAAETTSTDQAAPADMSAAPTARPVARLERTTSAVTSGVRATPARLSATAAVVTQVAPASVRTAVDHVVEALSPGLTRTTDLVADTLDRTVRVAHSVVEPLLATPADAGPADAAVAGAHRPVQAVRTHDRRASTARAAAAHDSATTTVAVVAPDASPAQSWPGAPLENTNGQPGSPGPAAPVGSWSGPSGATATLAGMLLVLFLLIRGRRVRDDEGLPPGPSYRPGNSPD